MTNCWSSVLNGFRNQAAGCQSTVIGGQCNCSSGWFSMIGNSINSCTPGTQSTALNTNRSIVCSYASGVMVGAYNCICANYGFIGGGICNILCNASCCVCSWSSTVLNGVGNNTTGGVFSYTSLGSGGGIVGCFITPPTVCTVGKHTLIGTGFQNRTESDYSAVLTGKCNVLSTSSSLYGVITGGCCNVISSCYGFANGFKNTVSGNFSSAMGCCLTASAACTSYFNNVCSCNYLYTACIPNGCLVCSNSGQLVGYSLPTTLNYGLYSQTSQSTPITATITESTLIGSGLGTLTVPANGFTVGDSFVVNMSGIMSAKNNDTIRIRVKSGSVTLADSGPLTLPTIANQVWNLSIEFTIRTIGAATVASIATFGQLHILKFASGTQEGFGFSTINNTTFNTTTSNTLNITAEWSSTSALNSIYSDLFVLNKIY